MQGPCLFRILGRRARRLQAERMGSLCKVFRLHTHGELPQFLHARDGGLDILRLEKFDFVHRKSVRFISLRKDERDPMRFPTRRIQKELWEVVGGAIPDERVTVVGEILISLVFFCSRQRCLVTSEMTTL